MFTPEIALPALREMRDKLATESMAVTDSLTLSIEHGLGESRCDRH